MNISFIGISIFSFQGFGLLERSSVFQPTNNTLLRMSLGLQVVLLHGFFVNIQLHQLTEVLPVVPFNIRDLAPRV
jgi:hypothetical protein